MPSRVLHRGRARAWTRSAQATARSETWGLPATPNRGRPLPNGPLRLRLFEPTRSGSQLFTQNSPGVGSAAEEFDFFGDALITGDFNNDGFADLAIGVPGESVDSIVDAGAANVLYGSPKGLTDPAARPSPRTARSGQRRRGGRLLR
jgi:hypothetical protein